MIATKKRPVHRGAIEKPTPAYFKAFQKLYGAAPGQFDRERLPDAERYYREQFGNLKPNARGWALTRCCFHDDKSPSLSVNVNTGAFRCFACDAHGGDVLSFHRRLHNLSFKSAALNLGAWRKP